MDRQSWESPQVETAVPTPLGCLCGYPVACEVVSEGERLGFLAFLDDEEASPTYGEQVKHCPKCGRKLALHRLLPRRLHEGKPTENLRKEQPRPGAS
jgi:hypothetical protein